MISGFKFEVDMTISSLRLGLGYNWFEKGFTKIYFAVLTHLISGLEFLANGLSITFIGSNPVVGKTGKNIKMQWNISWSDGAGIAYIRAFAQLQTNKTTQIVYWGESGPHVMNDVQKIYDDRLTTSFVDKKFTLIIFNAKCKYSGKYSIKVLIENIQLETFDYTTAAVTLNVYGTFF